MVRVGQGETSLRVGEYTDVSFSQPDFICVETNVRWRQLRIRGCIAAYVLISGHAPTFLHLFLLTEFFWTNISDFPPPAACS